MKKVLLLAMVLLLTLTMAACGGPTSTPTGNVPANQEVSSIEASDAPEWKEFLNDYEKWVDKYLEITKKYAEKPSDLSILSDYTKMITELSEWTTKTADMEKELKDASPAELAEYSAELARIAAKIAKATY